MFEDILNYNEEVEPDNTQEILDLILSDEENCPSCGSDNIGSSAGLSHVQMFCVDCGHMWIV